MLKQLIKKEHLLTAFFLVLAVVLDASYHGKEDRTDINELGIVLMTVGARRILMGPRLDTVCAEHLIMTCIALNWTFILGDY